MSSSSFLLCVEMLSRAEEKFLEFPQVRLFTMTDDLKISNVGTKNFIYINLLIKLMQIFIIFNYSSRFSAADL